MTEQYNQRNINNPKTSRTVTPAAGATDVEITPDDGTLLVDTANAAVDVNLPLAANNPGPFTVIATTAGASGNAATLAVQAGDTLVVPAGTAAAMTTDGATRTARSDGTNTWYIVAALD